MLGKNVRFLDPYNKKISRYASFNFRDEFVESFTQIDERWLLQHNHVGPL